MTNKEWLDYLAHNAPDELAAWFDAEHVETKERALDGDTDAQNADSREKLEADVYRAADEMDRFYCGEKFIDTRKIIGWLDRQAAITEREVCAWIRGKDAEHDERIHRVAELQQQVDELQELNEYHALQYELASEDADRLQAQVDRLTAERDHYRSKFGKCLDYADAIHALMDDEGMA